MADGQQDGNQATSGAGDNAGDKTAAGAQGNAGDQGAAGSQGDRAAAGAAENMVPQSRFDAEVAKKWEERRSREALERELAVTRQTLQEYERLADSARSGSQQNQQGDQNNQNQRREALSPAELERRVREQAGVLAATQDFNRRCNLAVEEGRKAHEDFDKIVLGDLTRISPVMNPQNGQPVLPPQLVEAALETGHAHEVLYALGKDTTLADRIMSYSPTKMAIELGKVADKIEAQRAAASAAASSDQGANSDDGVSRAPAPAKEPKVRGSATPAWNPEDTEHFDTAEWIRRREADVKKSREQNGARR